MTQAYIIIDMQNDFIDGSLGTPEAQAIVPHVEAKIVASKKDTDQETDLIFTQDTGAFEVQPNDRILICSDGLTSFIGKPELCDAIGDYSRTEREIINDLFGQVYENGAKDNVTAILTTI